MESEERWKERKRSVKVTFGDDIADDTPPPPPPDFLLITFLGCFFSSLSLSLSSESLESTLSTLECRVLLWTGGGVSFGKLDFFTGGFFVGGAFAGCWWLALLPFTYYWYTYIDCFEVIVILKIVTFDFCGRSVGGDGDFFDFKWEPETSLDGESQIIKTGDPLHFNRSWSYLLSDVSVSSLPLPLNIDAAFADEDLTPSADF